MTNFIFVGYIAFRVFVFLGAFSQLRKAPVNLRHIRPSVRPSVRIYQLNPYWTECCEI
jgi:hypothetical protein